MQTQVYYDNFFYKTNPTLSKLLNLFYFAPNKLFFGKSDKTIFNWFPHLYYKNPVNLLFSNDQFLYEFLLKYPQRKKTSEYKLQLKEQKKLSLFYGCLSKKQIRKYFIESHSSKGEFSKQFIGLLERRLDVIIYRSQFVKNISIARQLISHKKVLVNQKIISIPSYLANPGDIISIPDYRNLKIPFRLKETFNSQNVVFSNPEMNLKEWKFKNKFMSKKQIQTLTSLVIKKIQYRAEIQTVSNPFLTNSYYKKFYIFKSPYQAKILKLDVDNSKKLIFKTLSNFFFEELSKEIFFINLNKNILKKLSKNIILSNLNLFGIKPLHLELSYKIFSIIFLYSPQRVHYPFSLDFDLLKRAQLKS